MRDLPYPLVDDRTYIVSLMMEDSRETLIVARQKGCRCQRAVIVVVGSFIPFPRQVGERTFITVDEQEHVL